MLFQGRTQAVISIECDKDFDCDCRRQGSRRRHNCFVISSELTSTAVRIIFLSSQGAIRSECDGLKVDLIQLADPWTRSRFNIICHVIIKLMNHLRFVVCIPPVESNPCGRYNVTKRRIPDGDESQESKEHGQLNGCKCPDISGKRGTTVAWQGRLLIPSHIKWDSVRLAWTSLFSSHTEK